MPAPASGPLLSTRSHKARAPRAWPRASGAIPRPSWVGCTPITLRVLTRSRSAAPGADPPLREDRRGASRGGLRRPAYGGHPTPRRSRPSAALDPEAAGAVCARALRPPLLSRDDPHSPAPPQAVVEESQEAAGPGRSGAATSVHRAAPERAGRRSTRSASRCLSRRGTHPSRRGPRLRLGRARPASLGYLLLAGPVRTRLVLRAISLQRGPGAALAFPARQW